MHKTSHQNVILKYAATLTYKKTINIPFGMLKCNMDIYVSAAITITIIKS